MKKILWLIVCLMTMVTFTSCSSDDDEIVENYSYLNGEWFDAERGLTFIIYNGWVEVRNFNGSIAVAAGNSSRIQFEIENDTIIFYAIDTNDYSKDIEYYEKKIDEIRKELETARGSRIQYLIDELNKYISCLREAKSYQQSGGCYYYGKIYKRTSTEFEFGVSGKRYNLKRK